MTRKAGLLYITNNQRNLLVIQSTFHLHLAEPKSQRFFLFKKKKKWYLCLNSGRQASFVSFAYVGGTFGTILALPLCGLIIKTLGWQVKNGILNFFDIVVFIYLAFITNQLIVHVT